MLFLSEKLNDPRIPGKILFNEDEKRPSAASLALQCGDLLFLQGGFVPE